MTDKLHCPFCGAELESFDDIQFYCPNRLCKVGNSFELPTEIWQALIDGKAAQENLTCIKHNYSVLAEQREIAYQNYLKITGDLQKKLNAAQDVLNGIAKILLLHTNKPSVLTVKGKQEIRRRIASITTGKDE